MEPKEYEKLLKQHDWYYMMSEDHSIYKRGSYNYNKLEELANTQELKDLFKQYKEKNKV